jgi:repressor LexA
MLCAPPLRPLSSKQRRILSAIGEFISERGYSPTIEEIGTLSGIPSTSTVYYHLGILDRRGEITRDPRTPRSVRLREACE